MSLATLRARARRVLERRRLVVGINRRNVELVYPNNARRDYPIANDKLLGKVHLERAGVPVPETLVECPALYAVPRVVEQLSAHEHFVVKPANGSGGEGILVVRERLAAGQWRTPSGGVTDTGKLRRHLADIIFGTYSGQLEDRAFVERRIEPHSFFSTLWADGLCDVRVITLRGEPVLAMVRVPTHRSRGRANLHQGGIGLAVDLATGRIHRAVSKGELLERHPESGQALLGLVVPRWPQLLDVARRAGHAVPLGYLGTDIVVDRERGPLVLEINARPGLEIQNVNGIGLGAVLPQEAR